MGSPPLHDNKPALGVLAKSPMGKSIQDRRYRRAHKVEPGYGRLYPVTEPGLIKKVEVLMKNYGTVTHTAFLDNSFEMWIPSAGNGAICVKLVKKVAMMYGEPLCEPGPMKREMTLKFEEFCRRRRFRVCIVGATKSYYESLGPRYGAFGVGVAYAINPMTHTGVSKNVKRAVKAVTKAKIKLRVYDPARSGRDFALEEKLWSAYERWCVARTQQKGAASNFTTIPNGFMLSDSRHLYTLENGTGEVTSYGCLLPIGSEKGYVIEPCLSLHPKLNLTEYLIVSALEILKKEKCEFFTFGMDASDKILDLRNISRICAKGAYHVYDKCASKLNFAGKIFFHKKFNPSSEILHYMIIRKPLSWRPLVAYFSVCHVSTREILFSRTKFRHNKRKDKPTPNQLWNATPPLPDKPQ